MPERNTKQIRAFMTFEAVDEDELNRILDHHMEYMIDFDDMSEVIESVHGVQSYSPNDKHDTTKLQIMAEILSDILESEPSDEDLDNDDDAIELYANLHNLKEAMQKMGIL